MVLGTEKQVTEHQYNILVSPGRLHAARDHINFPGKQMSPAVVSCSELSARSRDADDKWRKQTVGTFLTMLIALGVV